MKKLLLAIITILLYSGVAQATVQNFTYGEPSLSKRKFYLFLVDASDLKTPETGEANGQTQVSYNGASYGNTLNQLNHIGNGTYFLNLETSEITAAGDGGKFIIRYPAGNCAEWQGIGAVSRDNNLSANIDSIRSLLLRLIRICDEILQEVKEKVFTGPKLREIIEE